MLEIEELLDRLCEAARRALKEPGKAVDVPGLPGYGFEWLEVEGELLPGLHTPRSFDVGYGLGIARMCGLDYKIRRSCVLDGEDVDLLIRLYGRGWFARVWRPDDPDCWAEIVEETDEHEEG
ncbi:hypothetical protein [Aeropyrum camini]|uniref:Uncharacterized protein conserved in bacteria n=1 Tax=Aeropyrum camini SY1 = JCM 12091 TaxID=1198449 RepID=U3TBX4_9CREN|nr:hypothetical protein [Aeropyrum camini]BAN89926.1 uncharacterized protein conserved in bacteria [Aeropyrum camini SY1 = JCM 12091]